MASQLETSTAQGHVFEGIIILQAPLPCAELAPPPQQESAPSLDTHWGVW